MPLLKNTKLHFSQWVAVLIIVLSTLVIMGWLLHVPALTSFRPGTPSMKFNAALAFLLLSLAFWILEDDSTKLHSLARGIVWLIIVFGIFSASQTLLGFNAGIDELFCKDYINPAFTIYPGRPSLQTSFSFAIIGIVLLLISYRRAVWLNITFLLVIFVDAALFFLSQFFGTSFLSRLSWVNQLALNTPLLFMMFSLALLKSKYLRVVHLHYAQKAGLYFGSALLLLCFIFFAIQDNNKQRANSERVIQTAYQNQLLAEQLGSYTGEMQAAVTGFNLTGDSAYLLTFNRSTANLLDDWQQLKKRVVGNSLQKNEAASLDSLIHAYVSTLKTMMQQQQQGKSTTADLQAKTLGVHSMAMRLKQLIRSVQQQEKAIQQLRDSFNKTTIANSNRIITLFLLLTLLLIVSTFWVIYRNTRQRNVAEAQLKASEAELRKSMENLAFALETAGIGTWSLNLENGEFKHSAIHDKILGYKEPVGYWSFNIFINKHVVQEDRQKVTSAWEEALAGKDSLHFDCRIYKADGSIGWVWCKSRIFYTDEGKPAILMGFLGDETQTKRAEQEIKILNANLEQRVIEKTREILDKETHFKRLLENMQEGIQIIDPDWRYLFVNKAAALQCRSQVAEMIGYTLMDKFPGVENTELFQQLRQCMQERTSTFMVNELHFPDGSKGCFKLSVQPVPEGLLILSTDISDQIRLEKELLNQQVQQQILLTQLTIEAQEKERNDLALELHDNINQILAAAKIYLTRAKKQEPISAYLVSQGYDCVNQAIHEIRKLSHTLVTPTLGDTGLFDALAGLVKQYAQDNIGPNIIINNNLQPGIRLDEKKELMLYRIVQEQLHNIHKHAKAGNVTIDISSNESTFYLCISDDGVGFDADAKAGGVGLRNIKSRVEFYSGNVHIESAPGKGTRLNVWVPL